MANLERLKRDIADIVSRPNTVKLEEIERIFNQLKILGWPVSWRRTDEQVLFRVEDVRLGICDHHRGSSHIKPKYVKAFKNAMLAVGLYDEERR